MGGVHRLLFAASVSLSNVSVSHTDMADGARVAAGLPWELRALLQPLDCYLH